MFTYILTFCGVVALAIFLLFRDKKSSVIAIMLKTLTSILFIVSGIYSLYRNVTVKGSITPEELVPLCMIVVGLILGMVGDIFLDFKIYFKALNMRFLCLENDHDILMLTGMSAFGIGHILYIISILLLNPTEWIDLIYACCIGAVLITVVMTVSKKIMKMDFRKFFVPAYIYGFLLSTFVFYNLFMMLNNPSTGNIIMFVGSLLFIISDLILTITYFSKKEDYDKKGLLNPESRFMIVINHTTYYAAQFLIAIAILFL